MNPSVVRLLDVPLIHTLPILCFPSLTVGSFSFTDRPAFFNKKQKKEAFDKSGEAPLWHIE